MAQRGAHGVAEAAPDEAAPRAPSRRAGRRDIVVVALGLVAGLGISAVAGGIDLPGGYGPRGAPIAAAGPLTSPAAATAGVVPGDPAPDPASAVETFLDAEIAGHLEQSYRLLSGGARAAHRSAAGWISAHADLFPITGYEIVDVVARDSAADVSAEVTMRSSIDEVVGLVPARASVVWVVVAEDGGWLVDYDAARFTARYPDDAGVVDAAAAWLEARVDCRASEEYGAGLVGTAGAAVDALCDARPRPRLSGAVGRLDASDGAPFVSAFGPSAIDWARTVEITGATALRIVLAPVDDGWLVVGAIPTR